jgi:Zn-dependent protease with chaperone function
VAIAHGAARLSASERAHPLESVMRRRAQQAEEELRREGARRRRPVVRELADDGARRYVAEIVNRVARQTGLKNRDRITYEILEWDVANAFVTPEMKVYVTTGLMEMIESDDELACVIGHELAHVAARHIAGRAKQAMIWQGLVGLAMAAGGGRNALVGSQVLATLSMLRYGRKQEMEADRLGMRFARVAGYDPTGMIPFLRKMEEKDGKMDDPLSVWISTHPPAPARIAQARRLVQTEGLQESRILKLSFNIRTDRQVVDLSRGIPGSAATTTASGVANLLVNGKLHRAGDGFPGWHASPPGALSALAGAGVRIASSATAGPARIRSDPVVVRRDSPYLVRARYRARAELDLTLAARFRDLRGATVGVRETTAHTTRHEEGRLALDVGGPADPVPVGAATVSVEVEVGAAAGDAAGAVATAEIQDVVLEAGPSVREADPAPVAGNLAPNPGFEEAATPQPEPEPHAAAIPGWRMTRGHGEIDRQVKASGGGSLKMTAASTREWAEVRSERLRIEPGYDYHLSGMLRSSTGAERMSLGLEFHGADGKPLSTAMVAAQGVFPPAEFTRHAGIVFASGGRFTLPRGTASVAIVGSSGYYTTKPCWFDDIALVRVQAARGGRDR